MKLPESAAFRLFDLNGITHPKLNPSTGKVVVKADLPMGGKKKAGLVQICDIKDVQSVSKKMGVPVIVEEFIEHRDEYFVALKAVREGIEVYYSGMGGIDVEENWERVEKKLIDEELLVARNWVLVEEKLFNLVAERVVRDWIVKLIEFFDSEDATYLEINPFTVVNSQVMPLGVVLVLDEAAEFRHSEWVSSIQYSVSSEHKTEREKKVAQVDSEIKGSIKLVEVPREKLKSDGTLRQAQGDRLTAVMGGGAGAALFLCDAILENGFALADYAEFSGNPPVYAVAELVKQLCAIPGVKNLVIGSGIANFTDVYSNFQGIIQGLSEAPQAKKMKIVIQRLGPGEDRGMEIMKEFIKESGLNIQVFDRTVPLTEIVKKLKDNG